MVKDPFLRWPFVFLLCAAGAFAAVWGADAVVDRVRDARAEARARAKWEAEAPQRAAREAAQAALAAARAAEEPAIYEAVFRVLVGRAAGADPEAVVHLWAGDDQLTATVCQRLADLGVSIIAASGRGGPSAGDGAPARPARPARPGRMGGTYSMSGTCSATIKQFSATSAEVYASWYLGPLGGAGYRFYLTEERGKWVVSKWEMTSVA